MSVGPISEPAGHAPPGRLASLTHIVLGNPLFMVGLGGFALVLVCAAFAPWIAPHDPNAISFADKLVPPSLEHPFGTDALGRDIFSRVIHGARTSV